MIRGGGGIYSRYTKACDNVLPANTSRHLARADKYVEDDVMRVTKVTK